LLHWLGVARSKFDRWSRRLGTPNRHNGRIPHDFWLEDWEKAKIIAFHDLYPLEGYRRLAYMMLDAGIVAVSPSSVYRVLTAVGKLARQAGTRPERRPRGQDRDGRHDAAPRLPGIGPNAINPSTNLVFILQLNEQPRLSRFR